MFRRLLIALVLGTGVGVTAPAAPSPAATPAPYARLAPALSPAAKLPLLPVRDYYTGPKGGCYYVNRNGNKSYVDRSLCGSDRQSSGLIRGPRGGCYYINGNGGKTYVARSWCR